MPILEFLKKLDIKILLVEADSGSIGDAQSNEFACLTETGEDIVVVCQKCRWAANNEVLANKAHSRCPRGHAALKKYHAIENGHIFKLDTKYSHDLQAYFVDKHGKKKPIIMGCYGLGLGRLLATVVEIHHDERGIIWPMSIAPFQIHLMCLGKDVKLIKTVQLVYNKLQKTNFEVLWDDREESAGVKLADSDLIGIPVRLILSHKTGIKNIELKLRNQKTAKLLKLNSLLTQLKSIYV